MGTWKGLGGKKERGEMMNNNFQKYLRSCIFRAGDVPQLAECLISVHKTLGSIPSAM